MNKNDRAKSEKINSSNKIEDVVNEYIKKIYELDNSLKSLDDKIKQIDKLTDNLIDYCVKKKIFFYVENKINYTQIVTNFKIHLIKFIKNLVDPTNTIINKYIINSINGTTKTENNSSSNPNWDNVSDINSIMFKNFKNLNESFDKNVSFDDKIQITNYDEYSEGFEFNLRSNTNSKIDTSVNLNLMKLAENTDGQNNTNTLTDSHTDNLSLYIKILVNQNKYLVEFISKLISMCKILSDQELKYKKLNPYE
jgi:hypothetical protein